MQNLRLTRDASPLGHSNSFSHIPINLNDDYFSIHDVCEGRSARGYEPINKSFDNQSSIKSSEKQPEMNEITNQIDQELKSEHNLTSYFNNNKDEQIEESQSPEPKQGQQMFIGINFFSKNDNDIQVISQEQEIIDDEDNDYFPSSPDQNN